MRRSEAARQLDVHRDTLLVLEREGRFSPQRDWRGHRRYTEADIQALRAILYPGPARTMEPTSAA
jgi:DNA-binding transcriptional MerR regulator